VEKHRKGRKPRVQMQGTIDDGFISEGRTKGARCAQQGNSSAARFPGCLHTQKHMSTVDVFQLFAFHMVVLIAISCFLFVLVKI
jgi:hypothetical protein